MHADNGRPTGGRFFVPRKPCDRRGIGARRHGVTQLSFGDNTALHQQLGRIEGKIDSLSVLVSRAHTRIDRVEQDIRSLERNQSRLMAYATVLASAGSAVVSYVVRLVFMGGTE